MRYFTLLFFIILLSACQATANETKIPYPDFLIEVKAKRQELKQQPISAAKEYFFSLIHEKVPEYWNGTPWDFNGVTRTPGKGQIACGYFITNTLSDFGFPIERVKLAQAASSVLIKATAVNIFTTSSFDKLKAHIKSQPDKSVLIVGLDFHTGYITLENGKAFFIHSNYINRTGVMKEEIDKSDALKNNKFFMIGNVGANEEFIRKWIE